MGNCLILGNKDDDEPVINNTLNRLESICKVCADTGLFITVAESDTIHYLYYVPGRITT